MASQKWPFVLFYTICLFIVLHVGFTPRNSTSIPVIQTALNTIIAQENENTVVNIYVGAVGWYIRTRIMVENDTILIC